MSRKQEVLTPVATRLASEQAREIAASAYVYGFPLVLMDVTREVMTAQTPGLGQAAVNQFAHARMSPADPPIAMVPVNADTLYSTAWLDLSNEPVVLCLPPMGHRFYLMPVLDAWTNVVASPGMRTTGGRAGRFALVGPRWRGALPRDVQRIQSPTALACLVGRTEMQDSDEDRAAAHHLQDQYALTPLSRWSASGSQPAEPTRPAPVDTLLSPIDQVFSMGTTAFFERLNRLMVRNPPSPADEPTIARMIAIGVAPGAPFDLNRMRPARASDIEHGAVAGRASIVSGAHQIRTKTINNWELVEHPGRYGTDYLRRAIMALSGLGLNVSEDLICLRATEDSIGHALSGAHRYTVTFPVGHVPPVNAFWSLTLYDNRQALVKNAIGRYALGDRGVLRFAHDRSLTLSIQREAPPLDQRTNWLPAPGGAFHVILRLYWPKGAALNGTWLVPPIECIG